MKYASVGWTKAKAFTLKTLILAACYYIPGWLAKWMTKEPTNEVRNQVHETNSCLSTWEVATGKEIPRRNLSVHYRVHKHSPEPILSHLFSYYPFIYTVVSQVSCIEICQLWKYMHIDKDRNEFLVIILSFKITLMKLKRWYQVNNNCSLLSSGMYRHVVLWIISTIQRYLLPPSSGYITWCRP
jgi:hypothetical protein